MTGFEDSTWWYIALFFPLDNVGGIQLKGYIFFGQDRKLNLNCIFIFRYWTMCFIDTLGR